MISSFVVWGIYSGIPKKSVLTERRGRFQLILRLLGFSGGLSGLWKEADSDTAFLPAPQGPCSCSEAIFLKYFIFFHNTVITKKYKKLL